MNHPAIYNMQYQQQQEVVGRWSSGSIKVHRNNDDVSTLHDLLQEEDLRRRDCPYSGLVNGVKASGYYPPVHEELLDKNSTTNIDKTMTLSFFTTCVAGAHHDLVEPLETSCPIGCRMGTNTCTTCTSSSSASGVVYVPKNTTANTSPFKKSITVNHQEAAPTASLVDTNETTSPKGIMMMIRQNLIIDIPNDFDVLCGRGKPIQQHLGNILLRKLVDLHMNSYIHASREQRKRLVEKILQAMKTKNMRFLKVASRKHSSHHYSRRLVLGSAYATYCDDDKKRLLLFTSWIEINDNDAKDKIGHCFRSRLP